MSVSPNGSPVPLSDTTDITNSPTLPVDAQTEIIRLQLIPWSSVPMVKPVLNEVIERRVREGQTFNVGRQVTKEIQPGQPIPPLEEMNPLDCWVLSKVVSRKHAEFSIQGGVVYLTFFLYNAPCHLSLFQNTLIHHGRFM